MNLTPMKKIKNSFSNFYSIIEKQFSFFALNESQAREIPFPFQPYKTLDNGSTYKTNKKGVESDHIKIYKDKHSDVSFAFSFDYKEKSESEWTVIVNMKLTNDNSSIITSNSIPFSDFRIQFNNLIKELKLLNQSDINSCVVLNLISKFFIDTSMDLTEEILKTEKQLELSLEDTKKIFSETKYILEKSELNLINSNNEIKKQIESLEESKKIKELEKELKQLKSVVNSKKLQLEKKYNIKHLKEEIYSLKIKLRNLSKNAETIVFKFKKTIPKIVAKKLKYFQVK